MNSPCVSEAPQRNDDPNVQLNIVVATLSGCPESVLDDPSAMAEMLEEGVRASGLTLIKKQLHQFEPHGITGAAILAESHVAFHTWPTRGLLFLDIATCTGEQATKDVLDRICDLVPHEAVRCEKLLLGGDTPTST